MMSGSIFTRNYSSMLEIERRTKLKLRALSVKGIIAFIGYKIGTILFTPMEPHPEKYAQGYAKRLNHMSKTKQSLKESEIKLQKNLEDMKKFRAEALRRKEEEERALK